MNSKSNDMDEILQLPEIIPQKKGRTLPICHNNIDDMRRGSMESWLLSTFSFSNSLVENKSIKDRILMEEACIAARNRTNRGIQHLRYRLCPTFDFQQEIFVERYSVCCGRQKAYSGQYSRSPDIDDCRKAVGKRKMPW